MGRAECLQPAGWGQVRRVGYYRSKIIHFRKDFSGRQFSHHDPIRFRLRRPQDIPPPPASSQPANNLGYCIAEKKNPCETLEGLICSEPVRMDPI